LLLLQPQFPFRLRVRRRIYPLPLLNAMASRIFGFWNFRIGAICEFTAAEMYGMPIYGKVGSSKSGCASYIAGRQRLNPVSCPFVVMVGDQAFSQLVAITTRFLCRGLSRQPRHPSDKGTWSIGGAVGHRVPIQHEVIVAGPPPVLRAVGQPLGISTSQILPLREEGALGEASP